ncbi:MAG: hypothetical protein LQ338_007063 [Usnochroma carphineum]|nr:MAG: hypothetical protein LQ338_007063 [Usnochroma carphineum]
MSLFTLQMHNRKGEGIDTDDMDTDAMNTDDTDRDDTDTDDTDEEDDQKCQENLPAVGAQRPAPSRALDTPGNSVTANFLEALLKKLGHSIAIYRGEPPYKPSRLGKDSSGLAMRLLPGHNTCPLCRAEVFARPVLGESLRFIRLNIRLWDIVYKLLGMVPHIYEKVYRYECVEFIRTWKKDRRAMGEKQRAESYIEKRWLLINGAASLITARGFPDMYYCLVSEWTRAQRHDLWEAGQRVRHHLEELPFRLEDEIKQRELDGVTPTV